MTEKLLNQIKLGWDGVNCTSVGRTTIKGEIFDFGLSNRRESVCPVEFFEKVASLLGLSMDCLDSDLPLETGSTGLKPLFVPVLNKSSMMALVPDFEGLRELSESLGVESIVVHSMDTGDPEINVRVRDLWPAIGVNEEPASGTTNGAVGSYLVKHGKIPTDKNGNASIVSYQGLEMGKPSKLHTQIHVDGHGIIDSVKVGGSAKQSENTILVY